MTVRFRLKVGGAEAEFEGDPSFLKTEFANLVDEIAKTFEGLPKGILEGGALESAATASRSDELGHSTNTIASAMDAKTGPDLALAAAAHLTLVRAQDRFSRKELLAEMQGAATFYNQNYSGNLSKILTNLTRGKRLNLVGTNMFALPKAVREEYVETLKGIA